MPANDDDILDLDDIIELTDVVAAPKAPTAEQSAPPKSGVSEQSVGADFGADFDAILKTLRTPDKTDSGAVDYPLEPKLPVGSPAPSDGHAVNPDEEIKMPSMADLDALLEELGVPKDNSQSASADDVSAAQDSAPVSDEIDALPLHSADGNTAAPGTAGQAVAADKGIDMNELDALLDNVLVPDGAEKAPDVSAKQGVTEPGEKAAAPELESHPTDALETTGGTSPAAFSNDSLDELLQQSDVWQQLLQSLKTERKDAQAAFVSLQERLSAVENALKPLPHDVKRLEERLSSPEQETAQRVELAGIQSKLTALESAFAGAREKDSGATPDAVSRLEEKAAGLAGALESIHTRIQPVLEGFTDLKEAMDAGLVRMSALEGRILVMEQRLNDMEASFDKRIAGAAARVIREEIGQLAAAFGDE